MKNISSSGRQPATRHMDMLDSLQAFATLDKSDPDDTYGSGASINDIERKIAIELGKGTCEQVRYGSINRLPAGYKASLIEILEKYPLAFLRRADATGII